MATPEVNISGREVFQAFVVAVVIVVADEGANLRLQVAGEIIVLKQDAIFERLMPPLDLSLSLRVIGRAAHMLDAPIIQPLSQLARDV